jgi:hypothetical protein
MLVLVLVLVLVLSQSASSAGHHLLFLFLPPTDCQTWLVALGPLLRYVGLVLRLWLIKLPTPTHPPPAATSVRPMPYQSPSCESSKGAECKPHGAWRTSRPTPAVLPLVEHASMLPSLQVAVVLAAMHGATPRGGSRLPLPPRTSKCWLRFPRRPLRCATRCCAAVAVNVTCFRHPRRRRCCRRRRQRISRVTSSCRRPVWTRLVASVSASHSPSTCGSRMQ